VEQAPPSVGTTARKALDRQPEIIGFLAGLFGPYPFSAAGSILDSVPIGFALETQTRPIYSPVFFGDPTGKDNESVVVHELAHQWVGDSLPVARWRDVWLNEGFASYAEWLWSEREGKLTAQAMFDAYARTPASASAWKVKIGDPGVRHMLDSPIYTRGAMTLHALRKRIGDTAFFALLRRWTTGHRGENVTVGQFTALAERVSGKQLDAFFRTWLFTPRKPKGLS
jgi:aminopeptidase N